jgi:uncharacterized protein (DUF302 family)
MEGDIDVSHGKTVGHPFGVVLEKAEQALKEEGFGILCRIDVQATLKEKLGEETAPYVILGACNPPFAHQALTIAPEVGVLMPCNVVVRDLGNGETRVEAINAEMMSALIKEEGMVEVAHEVNHRLLRVLEAL